jgi:PPOX class probable F420-dependent enzyme
MTEMNDAVRAFLSEPRFAVAATIGADGTPHQTVVWFLLDGDEIIVNTPEGSLKHKHLLRDGRMSLCVEDGYRYVSVSGSVQLSDDPGRTVYSRLGQHYQATMASRPAAPPNPRVAQLLSRERVLVRLKIEHLIANGVG